MLFSFFVFCCVLFFFRGEAYLSKWGRGLERGVLFRGVHQHNTHVTIFKGTPLRV